MTNTQWSQAVLGQQSAMRETIARMAYRTNLGTDLVDDLLSDVTVTLLGKRGQSFDGALGTVAGFCRMVAYQVANDKIRAMYRGGQFSGAYAGFGNAQLDADRDDNAPPINIGVQAPTFVNELADHQWLTNARAAVAAVLPQLSDSERMLWTELAAGTFDAADYATHHGIATATAHVRANRLRAKVRNLLKVAA